MNARSIERAAVRKMAKEGAFKTIQGRENTIQAITGKTIRFTTAAGRSINSISRKKLRKAISYFLSVRQASRRELEPFGRMSSAIMGIIAGAFAGRVKIVRSWSGRISIRLAVQYIFAGCDRAVRDMEVAAANGARCVLLNYWNIRDRKAWQGHLKRLGLRMILDSGAFTAWGKGIEIDVKEYAEFVQQHADVIHSFFNLDVIGDAAASAQNYEYLKSCGLEPIPVFHAGSDLAVLDAMIAEGHDLIGIGGTVKLPASERQAAIQAIFDRHPLQNYHFLGGGSAELLNGYTWFSADSTTWIKARKYSVIVDAAGQHKAPGADPIECMAATVRFYASLGA